jgi:hypothetical protein
MTELSKEGRASNDDAVAALVAMLGGAVGMTEKGIRLTDLIPILNADPDDDLSGLRLLAERGVGRESINLNSYKPVSEENIFILPNEARHWLVSTGRVVEKNGELEHQEPMDHLGHAALSIIGHQRGMYFYDAYREASNNRAPLSRAIINEIANHIIELYDQDN